MSPDFTRSRIWELKSASAVFHLIHWPSSTAIHEHPGRQPACPLFWVWRYKPWHRDEKTETKRRNFLKVKGLVNGRGYTWINLLNYHSLCDFRGHCFSNTPDCYLYYWFIQQSFLMCCCVGIEFFSSVFLLYHHVLTPALLSSSLKADKLGSWGPYRSNDWLKETNNQLVIKPQPLNLCLSS